MYVTIYGARLQATAIVVSRGHHLALVGLISTAMAAITNQKMARTETAETRIKYMTW